MKISTLTSIIFALRRTPMIYRNYNHLGRILCVLLILVMVLLNVVLVFLNILSLFPIFIMIFQKGFHVYSIYLVYSNVESLLCVEN